MGANNIQPDSLASKLTISFALENDDEDILRELQPRKSGGNKILEEGKPPNQNRRRLQKVNLHSGDYQKG